MSLDGILNLEKQVLCQYDNVTQCQRHAQSEVVKIKHIEGEPKVAQQNWLPGWRCDEHLIFYKDSKTIGSGKKSYNRILLGLPPLISCIILQISAKTQDFSEFYRLLLNLTACITRNI